MISEITGTITYRNKDSITVTTGGIGYEIFLPSNLKVSGDGEVIHLYTQLLVREDGWHLYGFQTREEKALFNLILTVRGVGPKVALSILSVMKLNDFYRAVLSADEKALTGIPGIGRKTAARIVVELRDRVGLSSEKEEFIARGFQSDTHNEAAQALLALGYTWEEAVGAIKSVQVKGVTDLDNLIKEALKALARF